MATVPKSRISRSKKRMRRSHMGITDYSFSTCNNCGSTVTPHRLCRSCGWYKGSQVVKTPETTQSAE